MAPIGGHNVSSARAAASEGGVDLFSTVLPAPCDDDAPHLHLGAPPAPVLVQWRGLTYTPWVRHGRGARTRRPVLLGVSGAACPRELCALMGPSGCGKTSLLSVLAGFVRPGDVVAGTVAVNHAPAGGAAGVQHVKRRLGFVFQEDLLLSALTVFETVHFAAALKLPPSVRPQQRRQRVHDLLQALGLSHVADTLVGSPTAPSGSGRGISGGERKRVAIASVMVTRPSLLMLDEATTGLDATTALSTVRVLRALADAGLTVMVSIHQPQTRIFNLFDRLLLLDHGRAVFDGPARDAVPFFEHRLGTPLPSQTNAADWLLDLCAQGLAQQETKEQHAATGAGEDDHEDDGLMPPPTAEGDLSSWGFASMERFAAMLSGMTATTTRRRSSSSGTTAVNGGGSTSGDGGSVYAAGMEAGMPPTDVAAAAASPEAAPPSLLPLGEAAGPKFETSFLTQLAVLLQRCNKQQRGSSLTLVTAIQAAGQALLTSVLWARLPVTDAFIGERLSLLFFLLIAIGNVAVNSSIAAFSAERPLLLRERQKGMYRMSAYFLAKTLTDGVNTVLLPICVAVCVYWATNLRPTAGAFFTMLGGFTLSLLVAQSMGLALSLVITDTQYALVLAPMVTLYSLIAGGFYVRLDKFPHWLTWLSRLSFARYAYTGLVLNEFTGASFACADPGNPAYGTSCPVPGEAVIQTQAMAGESIAFNYAILIAFQVGLRLASYLCLRFDWHIL